MAAPQAVTMSTKDVETGPGPVCEEVEEAEEKSCRPIGGVIGLVFSLIGIVFSLVGTLIWIIGSLLGCIFPGVGCIATLTSMALSLMKLPLAIGKFFAYRFPC